MDDRLDDRLDDKLDDKLDDRLDDRLDARLMPNWILGYLDTWILGYFFIFTCLFVSISVNKVVNVNFKVLFTKSEHALLHSSTSKAGIQSWCPVIQTCMTIGIQPSKLHDINYFYSAIQSLKVIGIQASKAG